MPQHLTENVVLVSAKFPSDTETHLQRSMQELTRLAETAHARPVCTITQQRSAPDASLFLGRGKWDEVRHAAHEYTASLIIVNHPLSPTQLRNIEALVNCRVIDRNQLILDIFALHARSKEGKLQVELAQLEYLLPRITGQGTALSRLAGGIGTRGPGETKLEVDRRHIRRRIHRVKRELEFVRKNRWQYRQHRKNNDLFQVALVGYTNAGKSTLFNQLTNSDAYVQNKLFATLDSNTKRIPLSHGFQAVVTDTVGFIQQLPPSLIAAFRSTLEEIQDADFILHVIDSTDDDYMNQMDVVHHVLADLNANDIPRLNVFNKNDLPQAKYFHADQADMVVSALNHADIERVRERIAQQFRTTMHYYQLRIPLREAKLLDQLYKIGHVTSMMSSTDEEAYEVSAYVPKKAAINKQLSEYEQPFVKERNSIREFL